MKDKVDELDSLLKAFDEMGLNKEKEDTPSITTDELKASLDKDEMDYTEAVALLQHIGRHINKAVALVACCIIETDDSYSVVGGTHGSPALACMATMKLLKNMLKEV